MRMFSFQVSTWFANARRRIKKESKITWTPKPRCNDQDENSSNEEENEKGENIEYIESFHV